MVDARGSSSSRGWRTSDNVLDKVIIEGYRFDPETGETVWAIDKNQTGKDAYRVKMQRSAMETDLVMFACTADHPVQPARAAQFQVHDQDPAHRRPAGGLAAALLVQPDRHPQLDHRLHLSWNPAPV